MAGGGRWKGGGERFSPVCQRPIKATCQRSTKGKPVRRGTADRAGAWYTQPRAKARPLRSISSVQPTDPADAAAGARLTYLMHVWSFGARFRPPAGARDDTVCLAMAAARR